MGTMLRAQRTQRKFRWAGILVAALAAVQLLLPPTPVSAATVRSATLVSSGGKSGARSVHRLSDGTLVTAYVQSGTLYVVASQDNGVSWYVLGGGAFAVYGDAFTLSVDPLDGVHLVYHPTGAYWQYVFGVPDLERTSIVWNSERPQQTGQLYKQHVRIVTQVRGSERVAHVFWYNATGYIRYVRFRTTGVSSGIIQEALTNLMSSSWTAGNYEFDAVAGNGLNVAFLHASYWSDEGRNRVWFRELQYTGSDWSWGTWEYPYDSPNDLLRVNNPSVAWNPVAMVYEVVWDGRGRTSDGYYIYMQPQWRRRYASGGWSGTQQVDSVQYTSSVLHGTSVTVDPVTGDVYFMYGYASQLNTYGVLLYRRYNASAGELDSPQQLGAGIFGLSTNAFSSHFATFGTTDLVITDANGRVRFQSIVFNETPYAPSSTTPSGGAWVHTTQPFLEWSFGDPDEGDYQSAYHVRVRDVHGNVLWDSGRIADGTSSVIVPAGILIPGPHQYSWEVRVWDRYGVGSPWASGRTFGVDTGPPLVSMVINDGAPYATSRVVTLSISASDLGSGIRDMRLSLDGGLTYGDWREFASSLALTLPAGDGTKIVVVQVRDRAGLTSVAGDDILLDTSPPAVSAVIDDGSGFTNQSSATVHITATDDGAGIQDMRISVDGGASWGDWQPYASRVWVELPGEGLNVIAIEVRDKVGWVGSTLVEMTVDTAPPIGTAFVFGIADSTGRVHVGGVVTLSLASAGTPAPYEVRYSRDGAESWTAWEPFNTSRELKMPVGEGVYQVAVQYRSRAGNVADPITWEVAVDRTPPEVEAVWAGGATATTTGVALLQIAAADEYTPSSEVALAYRVGSGEWLPAQETQVVALPEPGYHTVQVLASDLAGNTRAVTRYIWYVPD